MDHIGNQYLYFISSAWVLGEASSNPVKESTFIFVYLSHNQGKRPWIVENILADIYSYPNHSSNLHFPVLWKENKLTVKGPVAILV